MQVFIASKGWFMLNSGEEKKAISILRINIKQIQHEYI